MSALEEWISQSSLPRSLFEIIRMRASQINGCAYCLDMHSKDALALGVPVDRLLLLDAWREVPFYTDRERAALEWTEALTLVTDGGVPDEVYDRVYPHFSERELVELTWAVATINLWNRVAISMRTEPGHYRSRLRAEASDSLGS